MFISLNCRKKCSEKRGKKKITA